MVGVSLLTAIVVVLQLLGGGIKVGGLFSISLVLIPVVVGAAAYGMGAGAWLGLAFGVTVLLTGDAAAFFTVSPLGTIATVLCKGALCGLAAGAVYKLLAGKMRTVAVFVAALVAPVVNTGVFLVGCRLFFMDTIRGWAAQAGFANAGSYILFGLVGLNFLVEIAANLILAPVILRVLRATAKK